VTIVPDFKVTTFFEVEYRKIGASWRQSYCCTRGKYLTYGMVLWLVTLTNLSVRRSRGFVSINQSSNRFIEKW